MTQTATPEPEIVYPESDGKPMADNGKQFEWIKHLAINLEVMYARRDDVYVCGNMNWYPLEREAGIVQAPDVFVVFGRPKGFRSSYVQHKEGDVPLTVVFEVLSPSNTHQEMIDKFHFYDEHGVEEYYLFDPETNTLDAHVRGQATLAPINPAHNHKSPRLGIRFDLSGPEMVVFYPDGQPFRTMPQLDQIRADEKQRADDEKRRADKAEKDAADHKQRAVEGLLEALEALLEAKFQQTGLALMPDLGKIADPVQLTAALRAVRKASSLAAVAAALAVPPEAAE